MNFKKIKRFKIIFALLSTNFFLYLAISNSGDLDPKVSSHQNYKMLLLPLEMFVPQNQDNKGKLVTLYDDLNNIVVRKAFIYSEEGQVLGQNGILYKVEIENKDLIRIINFNGKTLRAFPQMEESTNHDSENYELVF